MSEIKAQKDDEVEVKVNVHVSLCPGVSSSDTWVS